MGVSINQGPEYRPQYAMILIIDTPDRAPLFWKPHMYLMGELEEPYTNCSPPPSSGGLCFLSIRGIFAWEGGDAGGGGVRGDD